MFKKALLGSVTVWYNPDPSFIDHIKSYSSYSNLLVIADNSLSDNRSLFDLIVHPNKIYLWNGANMGIAKAFNDGLMVLINNGLKFALTLDQDSFFDQKEIEKLIHAAEDLNWEKIGILSPIHIQQKSIPLYNSAAYTPAITVMASGNVVNLEIASAVGLFMEKLFIDHVDNEFCLRLNKNKYKVLIANAFIIHKLGVYRDVKILGIKFGGFISHTPERLYYFVRNGLYIIRNYSTMDYKYTLSEVKSLFKRFFKIFFEDDKSERFKVYVKGIFDSINFK